MSAFDRKHPDTAGLDRHFERKQAATLAGLHLPSEEELILGMGFFRDRAHYDAEEASTRWLRRLQGRPERSDPALVDRLEEVALGADKEVVSRLAQCLGQIESPSDPNAKRSVDLRPLKIRCKIYLGHWRVSAAAQEVACTALLFATREQRRENGEPVRFVWSSLAWSLYAVGCKDFDKLVDEHPFHHVSPAARNGLSRAFLVGLVEQSLRSEINRRTAKEAEPDGPSAATADVPDPSPSKASTRSKVVFREVGNLNLAEGKKVANEFKSFTDVPLPLTQIADLQAAQKTLLEEFPHARHVITDLLRRLVSVPHAYLPPMILLGSPGSGKTRFARRLLEELGMRVEVIACGGVDDGSWGGTPRRWSSGEPSLPVSMIVRAKVANPGVVLDEIEKVGSGRHNGNAADALLAMLERETAVRFYDPYVQAECDLSDVTWLMTANSLTGLPAPFRDRCRVLRFPDPQAEHLEHFARQMMTEILQEEGMDPRWAQPLDVKEIEQLGRYWQGGSLRDLQRFVRLMLDVRNEFATIN